MTQCRQQGMALVAALVVVAIAAVLGSSVLWRQSLWTRQLESSGDLAQARMIAKAGVAYARVVLWDDQRRSTVDHLKEGWTTPLPPTPVESGEIAGRITDQQGLFNLNNLVREGQLNERALAQYRRLLATLRLPAALADSLVDWIDADSSRYSEDGAEDDYYRTQRPPYLAANRPLDALDELGRVRGYSRQVIDTLKPYVMVAPAFSAINVNTAPPAVLASLFSSMTLADAQALAGDRDRIYFKDRADFQARHGRSDIAVTDDYFATISEYFLVEARARYGRATVSSHALLHRHPGSWPQVLWNRFD